MSIRTVWVVVGCIALLMLGVVGQSDYEQELIAEKAYIENVCNGRWPDYDGRSPNCD